METFGARLNRLRKQKRLKRCELAEALDVETETIARYERGEREPKISDAVALAAVLGVSVGFLITGVLQDDLQNAAQCYPVSGENILVPVVEESSLLDNNGTLTADIAADRNVGYVALPKVYVGKVREWRLPFAVKARDASMAKNGIRAGSSVVINSEECVADFDVALVFYKGKFAIKRIQRMKDGSTNLMSGECDTLRIPADEAGDPAVFKIMGKAVAYHFEETEKISSFL